MMRISNYGTRCSRILTLAALLSVPAFCQPVPNFSADLNLIFDPNSSILIDEASGNAYGIQTAQGTVHLQIQNGVLTWGGMQVQFNAALCAPLSANCSNPAVRHFAVNFNTFTAPATSNSIPGIRLNTEELPGLCIGGTALMTSSIPLPIGAPPQPFDPCSGVVDYVGPPPIDATTSYNVSFSVNVPSLGTHVFVQLGSVQFLPSTISQTFTSNTPAGSTLWFNSNGQFKNVTNGTTISFRNASISINGNGFTVPDSDIIFSSSTVCSTTDFDSLKNRWIIKVPTGGDDEVFLGGLSTVVAGAIPKGATVTWNATVFSNHAVSFKWKWGAAAYSTFPTSYVLDFVKPGHQTSCAFNNSDHAGTPEIAPSAIAGGTGSGGSNKTGNFSPAQSAVMITYTSN